MKLSMMRSTILATTAFTMSMPAWGQTAAVPPGISEGRGANGVADIVDPSQSGDIVVTAQKRSESIQRTPLAVTALKGDNLRLAGISNVDTLATRVPGLVLAQNFGTANVAIRGISLTATNFGAENPIAFHIDGSYIARPAAVLGSFFDVQRVEVLRGAQGTLYGRNATGGSINLITADPTADFSGYGQLTFGRYDHIATEGAVSGPLSAGSDLITFRIAFRTDDRDGWGKNEFNGKDIDDNRERAVRAKLQIKPASDLTILLAADYSRARDHSTAHYDGTYLGNVPFGVSLLGGTLPTNVRDVDLEVQPYRRNEFWGFSGNVSYEIGDVTLRSLTAYRGSSTYSLSDVDQTSAPLLSPAALFDKSRQFSEELQLTGHTSHSDWVAGLYYFWEDDRGGQPIAISNALLPLFGVPISSIYTAQGYFSGGKLNTKAYAAFGQYTHRFNSRLSLTLGGRYSIERKSATNQSLFDLVTPFDPAQFNSPSNFTIQCGAGLPTIGYANPSDCVPHKTFKAFTPKIGVEFQANANVLFYASATRGFKSGTYNFGVAAGPVSPEKVTDYEIGTKGTFLDGKLRVNLSGFYYDYKDLQVNKVVFTSSILQNAASAKIYGLEAEITAKPVAGLQFDLSGGYLHATFSKFVNADALRPAGDGQTIDETGNPAFNLKGNRLVQSPRLSGILGATYTIESSAGVFALRGEAVYKSRVFFTPFNVESASNPANTRFNASLSFTGPDQHFYASLNAKNLANKVRVTNGIVSTGLSGGVIFGYLEQPRTIDATIGYKF